MTDNHQELELKVFIDGAESLPGESGGIPNANGSMALSFMCDRKLGAPDMLTLTLAMMRQNEFLIIDKLKPGTPMKIVAGYKSPDTLFDGEIVYVNPRFAAGRNVIELVCFTKAWRLTVGNNQSRTWGDGFESNQATKDVLSAVVGESGAHKGSSDGLSISVDGGATKMEYKPQVAMNDFAFISQLAGGSGVAVKTGASASEIVLKPVELTGSAVLKIHRDRLDDGDDNTLAIRAEFTNSPVRQIKEVWVRGYDHRKRAGFVGKATAPTAVVDGDSGISQTGKFLYGSGSSGSIIQLVDACVANAEEAESVAQAFLDECSMHWMSGKVQIKGNPAVSPGDIIEMKDFGVRFSGKYLVRGVQHSWAGGGATSFYTTLDITRNGSPSA
jgi:hypothetical protein